MFQLSHPQIDAIPPRPKLHLGGKELYKGYGPFQGTGPSNLKIFRLTWTVMIGNFRP